jgi:SAM-dependent methyltransferase
MNGPGTGVTKRREGNAEGAPEPSSLLQRSPHEVVQIFCDLFGDELDHRSAHGLHVQDLRRYYGNLFLANGAPSPLGVYGYASRLAPALVSLRTAGSPIRLLDAGCGYGTESLLFALLGADVTGVELVPERVELARSRPGFYQDRVAASLSIRFVNADVIRYLEKTGPFDIIWIMEAISHIHPLDTFLPLAYDRLSPEGLLITSDPNALNPLALVRACRIRGALRHQLRLKAMDPDGDTPVYEAVERIFSVPGYARRVSDVGFEVTQAITSGFLASSLMPASLHRLRFACTLLTSLQRALQTVPILRLMGTNYTLVAQKVIRDDRRRGQERGAA